MAMEFTDDLVNDVTKMVEFARKRRQYSSSKNKTIESLVRENNHNSAANNRRRHSTMSTDIWINTIDNKSFSSFTERTDRTNSTIHSDSEDDDEEIHRIKLRRGRRSRTKQGLTSSDSVCSEESSVSRPSTSTRQPQNPEQTKPISEEGKSKCRSRAIGKNQNHKETRNNETAEYRAPDLENERRCCLRLPKQFRMYDPEIFWQQGSIGHQPCIGRVLPQHHEEKYSRSNYIQMHAHQTHTFFIVRILNSLCGGKECAMMARKRLSKE